MSLINKLTSSVARTISDVTEKQQSIQQPAGKSSTLGIAANSDVFESVTSGFYDSMSQQQSRSASIAQPYAKPLTNDRAALFDALNLIEKGASTQPDTRLKELTERLNLLKERAQDLKQQIIALEQEIKENQLQGGSGQVELFSKLKALMSDLADVQNEIKSIMQEIQSLQMDKTETVEPFVRDPEPLSSNQMYSERVLDTSQVFHTDIPLDVSLNTLAPKPDDDD